MAVTGLRTPDPAEPKLPQPRVFIGQTAELVQLCKDNGWTMSEINRINSADNARVYAQSLVTRKALNQPLPLKSEVFFGETAEKLGKAVEYIDQVFKG